MRTTNNGAPDKAQRRRERTERRRARKAKRDGPLLPKPPPKKEKRTGPLPSERLDKLRGDLQGMVDYMMEEHNSTSLASLITALLKVEENLANARTKEAREGATLDDSPAAVAGWLVRHEEEIRRLAQLPRGSL